MSAEIPEAIAATVGLLLALAARLPVEKLVKNVKSKMPIPPPSRELESKWKELTADRDKTNPDKEDDSGAILGDLERTLFYVAFWLGANEIIAGWFALKVAAKWEAWGTTGRLPDSLGSPIDEIDYLISRRRWASQRLMSFLIGTLANVLAALGSFIIAKHAVAPTIQTWFCF